HDCLELLVARGDNVVGLVTHEDNPNEKIWFKTPALIARANKIPVFTPANVNSVESMECIAVMAPDLILSVYYRNMIGSQILALARLGAFNLHGSLLPKYRGRAPINWAVLHGERKTGATLHYMTDKPDAGDIVAQQGVPILPDDTAADVLRKVAVAAEIALDAALPALIAGTA